MFSIAAAIILHRNLITNAVAGSDIQANYLFVELVLENGIWEPAMTSVFSSIPIVGTVPAIYSVMTGISTAFVFKVVYSLLFALVPLGIYYMFAGTFGANVALIGSYFFLFYFRTFDSTPGKTRIAQLFVVLLILVIITERDRFPGKNGWEGLFLGWDNLLSLHHSVYLFYFTSGRLHAGTSL